MLIPCIKNIEFGSETTNIYFSIVRKKHTLAPVGIMQNVRKCIGGKFIKI